MFVNFFIDREYAGCGAYDSETGTWEMSVSLDEETADLIAQRLHRGDRRGKINGVEFVAQDALRGSENTTT